MGWTESVRTTRFSMGMRQTNGAPQETHRVASAPSSRPEICVLIFIILISRPGFSFLACSGLDLISAVFVILTDVLTIIFDIWHCLERVVSLPFLDHVLLDVAIVEDDNAASSGPITPLDHSLFDPVLFSPSLSTDRTTKHVLQVPRPPPVEDPYLDLTPDQPLLTFPVKTPKPLQIYPTSYTQTNNHSPTAPLSAHHRPDQALPRPFEIAVSGHGLYLVGYIVAFEERR